MADPSHNTNVNSRLRMEAMIEHLIALLDEFDGDPDREMDDHGEDCGDAEPDVDAEDDELDDDRCDAELIGFGQGYDAGYHLPLQFEGTGNRFGREQLRQRLPQIYR